MAGLETNDELKKDLFVCLKSDRSPNLISFNGRRDFQKQDQGK